MWPAIQGALEARLSAAAQAMLLALEALLSKVLEPVPVDTDSTLLRHALSCPSPLKKSMKDYRDKMRTQAEAQEQSESLPMDVDSNKTGDRPSTPKPLLPTVKMPAGLRVTTGDGYRTMGEMLVKFDDCWVEYLDQFVVWKGRDAASLEAELIQMAVKLEHSMRQKLGPRPDSERVRLNADLQVSRRGVAY